MLSFSVAVVNKVELGLDQKLSMPDVSVTEICSVIARAHNLNYFFFIDVVDKVEWFYFEVYKLFPVLSVIHKARVATHCYHSLPHTT